ncbi:hypothetical protein [Sporosarcina sp. 179-K 8C2 HS]|uniref:hypothetical protein n=1 Tax=Sporosarcina sp. 179-K 8C2 HS TaxID=3142387 RepID=UPI0039A3A707
MSKELFITTDLQRKWMDKLSKLENTIRGSAELTDKLAAVKFAVVYSPNSIQENISELPNVQNHIAHIDLELMSEAGLHNPPMDDMVISKLAHSAIEDMSK